MNRRWSPALWSPRLVRLLVFAVLLGSSLWLHWFGWRSGGAGLTVYFPYGFVVIYISLYFFWEYHRIRRAKRSERLEAHHERLAELLDTLARQKEKGPGKPDP